MAESLINTKRRINTIKSTQKITKAMKLVASVKYQRWKKYYDESKPYALGMRKTMVRAIHANDFDVIKNSECLVHYTESKKDLYIIVTSTLGLCGAYNYNLFKEFDTKISSEDEFIFIGQKGYFRYHGKENKTYDDYINIMDEFTFSKVRRLRHLILQLYRTEKYSSINLVYTKYKNSITFIPTIEKLVPFDIDEIEKEAVDEGFPPIFDPDSKTVIDSILPHYLDALLYNKLIESQVSELSSRRNAMEAATDSAGKIVKKLMVTYNKSRQNAITQEITEVVAGANAGKKNENE